MHPTSPKLLSDMLIAVDLIFTETHGRSFGEYQSNPMLRAGVERCFEIVGEAVRRLERRDPDVVQFIPDYRTIIDFRNRLAHGYDTIDHELVWRYIQSELPELRDSVVNLLNTSAPGANEEGCK